MPIALIAMAWLLIMTGINGNYSTVGNQFETDVIGSGGSGGFLDFAAGILGIAIFFRVIGLPSVGRVFLILALLAFILRTPNILSLIETGITGSTATANSATTTAAPAATGSSS